MNLREASGSLRNLAFRALRASAVIVPGGRIAAFGKGSNQIGSILVVNLDRQPKRWWRVCRELSRFRTADGDPLPSITRRFPAVDARDGRAVAPTADIDSTYRVGDQLYVQPDPRLEECFGVDEPIRMTRQEVAIARSHVEVWKAVATGSHSHVLVLEDDIWFRRGAGAAIDRGWQAALRRCGDDGGPHLLYLSYSDAGGTAERLDICDGLFRPARGLWFLSGYVVSREGAAALLRAMPVVGPVDLWINYRFDELGALALSSPAILQRPDGGSDNSYSVVPYLARAGIIDSGSRMSPDRARAGPLLVWTSAGERESLAMALSMLGLRVRVWDGHEPAITSRDIHHLFDTFDALVDAPLTPDALSLAAGRADVRVLLEANAKLCPETVVTRVPRSRIAVVSSLRETRSWEPLCSFLRIAAPVQPFPTGAPRTLRLFRDDRPNAGSQTATRSPGQPHLLDDSPWILPATADWNPSPPASRTLPPTGNRIVHATMTEPAASFSRVVGTFPGNLASFGEEGIAHDHRGVSLVVSKTDWANQPYRSGAFASARSFQHGRFEAQIKAASGAGLVTGFFLYRDAPRQEIDIELPGGDPRCMLVNVYFNPGDEGTELSFGYRGSPYRIELGFDATAGFHHYAIEWQPDRIMWAVDGKVLHERVGWDPTPLPHLPMHLHGNLWVPRSHELAGRIQDDALPASATFREVSVRP